MEDSNMRIQFANLKWKENHNSLKTKNKNPVLSLRKVVLLFYFQYQMGS